MKPVSLFRQSLGASCASLGIAVCALNSPAYAADPALQQAIERGANNFQHNGFGGNGRVCESCHVGGGTQPGHRPDGTPMPSLTNAAAVFPRMSRDGRQIVTLPDQIHNCISGAIEGKVPAYGSDELNSLALYVTSLSHGKAIELGGQPK